MVVCIIEIISKEYLISIAADLEEDTSCPSLNSLVRNTGKWIAGRGKREQGFEMSSIGPPSRWGQTGFCSCSHRPGLGAGLQLPSLSALGSSTMALSELCCAVSYTEFTNLVSHTNGTRLKLHSRKGLCPGSVHSLGISWEGNRAEDVFLPRLQGIRKGLCPSPEIPTCAVITVYLRRGHASILCKYFMSYII